MTPNSNNPYAGILLCADFDGTLAGSEGIPEVNIRAIHDFCEKGGIFSISSGRNANFLVRNAGGLFNSPLICLNGTVIYDTEVGKTLCSLSMDSTPFETLNADGVNIPELVEVCCESLPFKGFLPFDTFDATTYQGRPIAKIVTIYKTEEACLEAKKQLTDKFPHYQFSRSFPTGLEQISPLAGKGHCVAFLKSYLNASKLICIGDFENDIGMLKEADISFAPRNAIEEVKVVAHRVVCSAEEGALAEVIGLLPHIL